MRSSLSSVKSGLFALAFAALLFSPLAHAQDATDPTDTTSFDTNAVTDTSDTNAPVDTNTGTGVVFSPTAAALAPAKKFDSTFYYARVEDVHQTEETMTQDDTAYIPEFGPNQKRINQDIVIRFLSGKLEGQQMRLQNSYQNQPRDLLLSKGDKVTVEQDLEDGKVVQTMVIDFARSNQALAFIIVFGLAILLYARRQGVSSILGFVSTFGILFAVFIPGIVAGWNPVILAVACSVIITFLVHFFVGGLSAKSISSTIGTAGGTIIAGLTGAIAAYFAHLHGLSSEDARNLFIAVPTYDFNGIFLASIIIGSLGAVMDVGISIGSAIKEVRDASSNVTFWQLYKAGVTVGKDILGTMSNTLILAYIGAALPLILLLTSYKNLSMALDYDFIVDEIVRSIAGSFGLLTAIPITAYFAALFEYRKAVRDGATKPRRSVVAK